ncbi:MAG: MauE/DoxX family redox-associated membrane protein [Gammaproteobacteria bacterium]
MKWQTGLFNVLKILFLVLLFSTAIGKLLDIPGFADVIETYQFGITGVVASVLALSIALFELQLGLYILRKPLSSIIGLLLTLMHSGYTLLAIITLSRGIDIQNCGCFGVFLARPMTPMTVVEDLILTAMSAMYWYLSIQLSKNKVN